MISISLTSFPPPEVLTPMWKNHLINYNNWLESKKYLKLKKVWIFGRSFPKKTRMKFQLFGLSLNSVFLLTGIWPKKTADKKPHPEQLFWTGSEGDLL